MPTNRKDYRLERARHLLTFEANDMGYKGRLYLAAEMRRISFNAWFNEYAVPVLNNIMDSQGVPKEDKLIFKTLAAYRPHDPVWKELLTGDTPVAPVIPRRRNARRVKRDA